MKKKILLLGSFAGIALAVWGAEKLQRGEVTTSEFGREFLTNLTGSAALAKLGASSNLLYDGGNLTNVNASAIINPPLGSAAGSNSAVFQPAKPNLTNWANFATNSVLGTNAITTFRLFSDGRLYGPQGQISTAGTTTAGFNEALLAAPQNASTNGPGGIHIDIGPGIYYISDTIVVPWSNAYHLEITGPGYLNAGIVQTVPKSALQIGVPFSFNRASFKLGGFFMASTTNAVTNLIYLKGMSDTTTYSFAKFGGIESGVIENMWFSTWQAMTNNIGWGFTPDAYNGTNKNNTIAVDVMCNFNNVLEIRNCLFANVLPIGWASDHGNIHDCVFGSSGRLGSNLGLENDWPVTSPFRMGAVITMHEPGPDINGNRVWNFANNTFINSALIYGIHLLNAGYVPQIFTYGDQIEAGWDYAATTGSQLVAVNPHNSSSRAGGNAGLDVFTHNYVVTNTSDFSTYRNFADPTNAVRIDTTPTNRMAAGSFVGNDGVTKQWTYNASALTNGSPTTFFGAGVIPIANLATGTPNGTKFIRDDGSLQAIAGGGDALTANPLSQFAATTSAQLAGVLSDENGSAGGFVRATGATLTTPTLGAATATTINKVTITQPASGSTLTVADGKTLTATRTVQFTSAGDLGVLTLPNATATIPATSDTLGVFASTTSAQLATVLSDETGGSGGFVRADSPVFTTQITSPKNVFTGSVYDSTGSGTPEGAVTAAVGSTYRRTDGGASTSFYTKESGSGNTGWVAYGAPGGGSQTPWTGAINGGGFALSNAGRITNTNGLFSDFEVLGTVGSGTGGQLTLNQSTGYYGQLGPNFFNDSGFTIYGSNSSSTNVAWRIATFGGKSTIFEVPPMIFTNWPSFATNLTEFRGTNGGASVFGRGAQLGVGTGLSGLASSNQFQIDTPFVTKAVEVSTNGNVTIVSNVTAAAFNSTGAGVGKLTLWDSDATQAGTIQAPSDFTATRTFTLPDASGTIALTTAIDDTAFASSWNGVTTIAPSKNAVYDWIHTFDTDDDGKVNVLDVGAGVVETDAGGVVSVTTPTGSGVAVKATSPTFVTQITSPKNVFTGSVYDTSGSGSPEGVVTAAVSSVYRRTDGGAATSLYIKESGAGNTGWVAYGAPSGSGAPTTATYITQTSDGTLSAEQALSALATGVLKVTTTTGVLTSLGASGAVPLNADGSLTTFGQVNALAPANIVTNGTTFSTTINTIISGSHTSQGYYTLTNLYVGTVLPMGTNYNISLSSNLLFTGVANIPTTTEGYGKITAIATGTVTITNPASMYFSDGLTNRTLTNGNLCELVVHVIPGFSTNVIYSQYWHP